MAVTITEQKYGPTTGAFTGWIGLLMCLGAIVPLVMDGTLRHREDIRDGLETAPQALVDLYTGDNTGKLMVKIADGP